MLEATTPADHKRHRLPQNKCALEFTQTYLIISSQVSEQLDQIRWFVVSENLTKSRNVSVF